MRRLHFAIATLLTLALLVPARPAVSGNWASVRTRNLFIISDASASELRQVASWLELFHAAVSGLTSRPAFNSSVPTVGIVFRRRQEFDQFKPLYQGKPAELAGYFQAGDDVNYIALPLEPGEPLDSVFHEYVHLFVKDNLPNAPLWLNEGLAEFYSTAAIGSGEATIGAPIASYVQLLRGSELLPLKTLFSVNSDSAHYHDRDKRGIFYAESWALVHYLMLANHGERQPQVGRYLSLTAAGVSVEAAFKMAFQADFATIEKELRDYLRRGSFPAQRVDIGRDSYGTIQTELLTEAEADYYLGDLLLHIGQPAGAEKYFVTALSLDQNLMEVHAALGMLRVRQGKFAEALRYLQRAAPTSENPLVHFFYAYALSRQGITADGTVSHYSVENLETMRSHLQSTIKLAPDFAEAYQLLAFINLVANERLDQSVELMKKAMSLEPNRAELKLVLAQIYLRQRDPESAHRLLEPLARQTNDQQLRTQAELLLATNSGGASHVPQFSTAAPTKTVSVVPPGAGTVPSGMRIDSTGPLPTAEEVVAKYIAALGGEGKIRQVTSRVTKGRARVPGEFTDAPFELSEKSPNKSVLLVKPQRTRSLGQGFDGTVGWVEDAPNGVHRLKGVELSELQRDCDFYRPLRLKANYQEVKLLGRVKIGYRESYLVEAKPAAGDADKFYFEIESGMLIRWDGLRSNWRERALVETYYDDWREVEGVRVPFRITSSSPHFTIAFTVDEVKHDVALDDVVFRQR